MADKDFFKFNWEHVPWITGEGENSAPKQSDNPAPKPPRERKKLEKPPPQAAVEFVEIDTSQEIKKDFPYSGSGKLKVLEGATLTDHRIDIQPLHRYQPHNELQDKEEKRDMVSEVLVDKATLEFKFTINKVFEPNAYYLDKQRPADAKYRLLVKVSGPQLDKDYYSREVEVAVAGTSKKASSSIFTDIDILEKAAIQEGYGLTDRISAFRKIKYDRGPVKTLLGMVVGGGVWDILIPGASHVKLPTAWNTTLLAIKDKLLNNPEMNINGDKVDIFHVFAGLDARNHPTAISLGGGIVKMRSNQEASTFIGDLGSVVVWYIKESTTSFYNTARVYNKQLLNYYFDDPSSNDQKCSKADMNGNIDSYFINPSISVFDCLEDYYKQSVGKYLARTDAFRNQLSRSTRQEIQEEIFNSAIAVAVSIKAIEDVALIFKDPGPGPTLKLPFIGDVGTPTYWEMYWNVSGWVTELLYDKIYQDAKR